MAKTNLLIELYALYDLFASKSPLAYQGPCLWSSFVKHFKIKNFLTIKPNVWPILVVHMRSIFYFNFFAGKTLIFRKPILDKWFSSSFYFLKKLNEIRRDDSTSLLSTFPLFLDGFCKISLQWLSKFTPPKVLINKMTALKMYT